MNKFNAMVGNNICVTADQEELGTTALVNRSRLVRKRGGTAFEVIPSVDGSYMLFCDGEILGNFYSRIEAMNALNAITRDIEASSVGPRRSALMH